MAKKDRRFTLEDLKHSKVAALNSDLLSTVVKKETSNGEYRLLINPIPKPRMVRSDAYKKRPSVLRYWEWKKELLLESEKCSLSDLPGKFAVEFHVQMPDSWSKKKEREYDGQPHLSTPDIDNLLKALQDCLCNKDSHIWNVQASKVWSYTGYIKVLF